MIEAVNSVIANASLLRGSVEQLAAAASFAGDEVAVRSVAQGPVAPYVSPYISLDTNYDTAVLQIRDSDTGDVVTQFPSETALQQRQRAETRQALAQSLQSSPQSAVAPVAPARTAPVAQSIPLVQNEAPAAIGGTAQQAIAALSAGAQSGQVTPTTVNVTA